MRVVNAARNMKRNATRLEIEGFTWNPPEGVNPAIISAMLRSQSGRHLSKNLSHTCWVFDYSISAFGACRVGRQGKWRERMPGVGHLYAPHARYSEDLRAGKPPFLDVWMLFRGGETAGLEHFVGPGRPLARFIDANGKLKKLLTAAVLIGKQEAQNGFWKAQACLFELLDCLHESSPMPGEPATYELRPQRATSTASSPFLDAVRKRLYDNPAEQISLTALASALGISVSTLCHKYQAQAGCSPMADRLARRLALAKSLLLKGEPLKSVAENTGFCDAFHLSKAFKRYIGLPPREYLRSIRPTHHG